MGHLIKINNKSTLNKLSKVSQLINGRNTDNFRMVTIFVTDIICKDNDPEMYTGILVEILFRTPLINLKQ